MTANWTPAEVFPPGEFLKDELEARNWTQTEFARIIRRPTRLVNEIIAGKRAITPETAMDFAAAFGTSSDFWFNLETAYQLFKASTKADRAGRNEEIAREAQLRERFPVQELIKRHWIEDSESYAVLEHRVLSFYGMESLADPLVLNHAAKRNYVEDISPKQLAWIFRVKQMAEALDAPKYSEARLKDSLNALELLVTEPEEIRHVPKVLRDCGVKLVVVEPMPGSKICGVCFWLDSGRTPVIGLTLLHDRIDNFWFVLRHEIEHVLRGDGKTGPIVDESNQDGILTSGGDQDAEAAANEVAANFCVPSGELENFINRVDPLYSEKKILGFANRISRHPGLVVGQIQNRMKRYNFLRKYLVKVRHIVTASALTDGYGYSGPIST